jgi:hypothetical protein
MVLWLLFKEGFVRHDSSHDIIFFATAPLLLAAFDFGRRRWVPLVAGLFLLCVVTCIVAGGVPTLAYRPVTSAHNFVHEAAILLSPGQRATVIDQSRHVLQTQYGVPAPMVALMRGQTVDVSPLEQTAAWVYPDIHFDPLPVIQDYSAYTMSLDTLDRSYVESPEGPRYILREQGAIDGRSPAFEPPATQVAIECRYHQVMATARWQLLQKGINYCGPMRSLGSVTTGFNHWVAVPAPPPGDSLVAAFHFELGPSWTVQTIFFKPPNLFMEADGGRQFWRFVAATGPDLHVLHTASTLGYSSPFVPPTVSSLRFLISGRGASSSGVSVTFYEIPVSGRTG